MSAGCDSAVDSLIPVLLCPVVITGDLSDVGRCSENNEGEGLSLTGLSSTLQQDSGSLCWRKQLPRDR